MKFSYLLFTSLLLLGCSSSFADENKGKGKKYDDDEGFGGPTSVSSQLEEDDKESYPLFRYKEFDEGLAGFKDWKHEIYEDTGLQFGLDYTLLHQKLSDTLPGGEDTGSTGIARFYSKWELVDRGGKNKGSLIFKVDHRHSAFSDVPANALGSEAGYLSQTGVLFSDAGLILVDLSWHQYFNEGQSAFVFGRFDPNDYLNVLGHASPWIGFSNLDTLFNMSIALADSSLGLAAGHWFENNTYVIGSVNDANGTVDTLDTLEEGLSELYKTVEFGWSPSRELRFFKNIHVTLWQMDERTAYGEDNTYSDESKGLVIGGNYTWDDEWMVFAKLGFSDINSGAEPQLYEQHAQAGFIKYFAERSDLMGMSVSHGKIPDEFGTPNDSQKTIEAFYRIQVAKNMALTPSVQYLIDPALNTEDDIIVTSLRLRVTL